jgi:hypothetical protein
MITEPQPQDSDLILGGEQPSPTNAAVLGGLAGLKQRFEQDDLQQKLAALVEAAQRHDEDGLSLLHRGLEDENLHVRAEAYIQLKVMKPTSDKLFAIVDRGIPLKAGDRLYGVYRSAITYGDSYYSIYGDLDYLLEDDDIDDWDDEDYAFYQSGQDSAGNKFEYVYDDLIDNYEHPCLIGYLFDEMKARIKSEAIYLETFARLSCNIYELYADSEAKQLDLKTWVQTNQIVVENVLESWGGLDWAYQARVVVSLQNQKRYDLLREIWEPLGYDRLAFVYEHVIDRPCYLRIGELKI